MSKLRLLLIAVVLLATSLFGVSSGSAQQTDCRLFPTGKQVCGRFLAYWDANGGLQQQGLPISAEFKETSPTDGKTYTVQYFERAVFEMHPENTAPYDVLLSLLGTAALKQRYPNGPAELPPPLNPVAGKLFPQTGKEVRGVFLDYWNKHGGLAQQGYPITNLVSEKSELDGKTYTVQYFERAVFEMHPENTAPYNVLLAQLGTFQYRAKYPNGAVAQPTTSGVNISEAWAKLKARPLKLPTVSPGVPCPTSAGSTVSSDYGPALGDGPVYPVGLSAEAKIDLGGALKDSGGFYAKVLWVARPGYNAPVLVRGGRTDGPGEVRFGEGPNPAAELRLDPTDPTSVVSPSGWREWRTYTRLRVNGCYSYQIDSPDTTKTVQFHVIQTIP